MAHFRDYTKSFIHAIAGFLPFDMLRRLGSDKLIFPFYHAVSDEPIAHIDHLYQVKNMMQFRADIDFLLAHYKPITAAELISHVRNGTSITEPSFLLSFDDGLSQVHEVIAPILREKGVSAVCFLNSGFIDNQGLFYRYKVSLIIEHLVSNKDKLSLISNRNSLDGFSKYLLSLGYKDTDEIDEIGYLLGLDFGQYLVCTKPYLSSEQIIALVEQDWYFGGHSVDHPHYHELEHEQQLSQTRQSIAFVKQHFGLDYSLFSFPFTDFGVKQDLFNTLRKDKSIDLSFGCAGMKDKEFPFHFQRIPMEDGLFSAEDILKREFLYYGMKAILGKNKIIRDA